MVTITEYAVRVKGTQKYLPRPQRRDGRGGSHLEPIDFSVSPDQWPVPYRYAQDMQIRSYATKKAASNLLSAWLQGKVISSSGYDSLNNEYYQENSLMKIPERKREDMEIVEITITLPD